MATALRGATRACRVITGIALLCLLSACAGRHVATPAPEILPPLQHDSGEMSPSEALDTTSTPELMALNDEMRDFVDRYVSRGTQRQRLNLLHRSLLSPVLVGIEYDPTADGTAEFAFVQGRANCLTYAHLFVSLARHAGLDARYLSMSLRPQWSRHGDRVALRQHVNVVVNLRNGEQYMVDIDPVPRSRIAHAEVISDEEAFALYHGNLAMDALLHDQLDEAYAQALRSLELSRKLDYLWVNLGAIYRRAGQDEAAEQLYFTALEINPDSRSAMNNLAVLYDARGDKALASEWEAKVVNHRQRNPYYHYYLGEISESEGDYDQAIKHYREAISLKDSDAEFHFRLAVLYDSMQRRTESIRYTEQAIERARLVGERKQYREFLERLTRPSVAGVDH